MYCFYDLEKRGTFAFPNGIVGHIETELFKSHKTRPVTEKTGRTGSLSRPHMWGRNLTVSHFCFLLFKCFSITSLMASVTNMTAFYLLDSGFLASVFALASDLNQLVPCVYSKLWFYFWTVYEYMPRIKSCKFAGDISGFFLIVDLISESN